MAKRVLALLFTLLILAGGVLILHNGVSLKNLHALLLAMIGSIVGFAYVLGGQSFSRKMATLLGHPFEEVSRKLTRVELLIIFLCTVAVAAVIAYNL